MTPTREQALTPAELRELCAQLSEDGQAMLHRAVHAAHMSGLELGRDQGLREAKEVCEGKALASALAHVNTDEQAFHIKAEAARSCAAAIEQLRGK